jgi:hypothetical protein
VKRIIERLGLEDELEDNDEGEIAGQEWEETVRTGLMPDGTPVSTTD